MDPNLIQDKIDSLKLEFEGEIYTDQSQRLLYATDASAYREIPLGVARPKLPMTFKSSSGLPMLRRFH
jgi:hypothetical protein